MIPLRSEIPGHKKVPWGTVVPVLIGLNLAAFMVELCVVSGSSSQNFFTTFTLTPSKGVSSWYSGDSRSVGAAVVSLFTSMFLHLSWVQLLGNLLFLAVFGPAVEMHLGKCKTIGLYLLSGLGGAALQIVSNPASSAHTLGALGAISGLMGAYLWYFPKAETMVLILPMPMAIKVQAQTYLLFYASCQAWGALDNWQATDHLAHWAMTGGFASGAVLAMSASLLGVHVWSREDESDNVCDMHFAGCQSCKTAEADDMIINLVEDQRTMVVSHLDGGSPTAIERYRFDDQGNPRQGDVFDATGKLVSHQVWPSTGGGDQTAI